MPVKPAYWQELDIKLNEIPLNEYGEPIASSIFGLTYKSTFYLTRFHIWKLQKKEDIKIDKPIDSRTGLGQLSAPLEFCQ